MKARSLALSALFMFAMSILLGALFTVNPAWIFAALIAVSFIKMPKGIAFMALQKEIWRNDIVGNLYKDNAFLKRCVNANQFVLKGVVVHIPVAGNPSTVKKNLTNFPAAVTERADTELTYPLDTFYSLPRRIAEIDSYELSYDKRQSVVGEDEANLIEKSADSMLYRWAPVAANTILTSGAEVETGLDGAAGNRLAFTKAIFATMRKRFNKAKILKAGRVALLTSDHYAQFLDSLSEAEKADVGRVANLEEGLVGRYYGFDIYERSEVLRYRGADGAYAVVDEQADDYAANADDRAASLFWQDTCTEGALGEVVVFDDTNNPLYFGDIFSALLRSGGRIRRTAGVTAVVEALVEA